MSAFDIHPDEAAAARLDAVMDDHRRTYGDEGPAAADVLGSEDLADLDAVAGPPARRAARLTG